MPPKTRKPFFEWLKTSLVDCINDARGEYRLKRTEVSQTSPAIDAAKLKALRNESPARG